MLALSYLSIIRFSDPDAGDFLHGQVSGDVLGLASGDSTFACYCEPKGRVLALMLVCRVDDCYYVIMSKALVQTVIDRLKIYVMRSKVSIEILDEFSVSGWQANELPQAPPSPIPAIALPGTAQWLVAASHDIASTTAVALQDDWKTAELQQGIVWLCPGTSGQFLPQMLGFDQLGAVNFRKGCYPGQEIVARTHYMGKVKRHPRVLNVSATLSPQALDSIQISGGGETYEAVVVDSGQRKDGNTTLFVVTRMDPDLVAEQIEYQDQSEPVI